jgi:hypothetical protein
MSAILNRGEFKSAKLDSPLSELRIHHPKVDSPNGEHIQDMNVSGPGKNLTFAIVYTNRHAKEGSYRNNNVAQCELSYDALTIESPPYGMMVTRSTPAYPAWSKPCGPEPGR